MDISTIYQRLPCQLHMLRRAISQATLKFTTMWSLGPIQQQLVKKLTSTHIDLCILIQQLYNNIIETLLTDLMEVSIQTEKRKKNPPPPPSEPEQTEEDDDHIAVTDEK